LVYPGEKRPEVNGGIQKGDLPEFGVGGKGQLRNQREGKCTAQSKEAGKFAKGKQRSGKLETLKGVGKFTRPFTEKDKADL